jgi:cell shape-determining protein MreC
LLKGAYDYFKNPKIKDEDVTLETSEASNNLPDNTLVAEVTDNKKI